MSIVAVVWRLAEPASVLAASAEARQPLVNTCAQHLQKQLERSGDANAAFRVYLLFDDGQLHARHDVLQICSHIYSSCDANLQAAERYVYDLLVVPISDADEVPLCKRAMLLAPTLSMVYNEPASSDVRALDQERKAVGVAPAAMLERVAHQHDDADREVTAAATRDVQAEARVFDHCCMGGSFDHLHSGHKLLLTAAALHTRTCIHIGITSGKLLANKKHAHLLEAFDARRQSVTTTMHELNPSVDIDTFEIVDAVGPAGTTPEWECLIASKETEGAIRTINSARKDNGLCELKLVAVPLVGGETKATKLSSTTIREFLAAKGRKHDTSQQQPARAKPAHA